MPTTTSNLTLYKPTVGGDTDTWGGYLNTNADTIAGLFSAGPALKVANGGTGATTASGALTNLGGTTIGQSVFTLANPSAITFPRFNANNTVSALSAGDFRTAIGAGTGNGTVTSVGGTGSANGLSLSGTVTSSGNLTLSGTSYSSNNVLLGNGTSAFQTVAPGSSGNVLTSNGSTWTSAAPGGGNWVYLNGTTASNVTSVNFSLTGGVYYVLLIKNMYVEFNGTNALNLTFGGVSGSTYNWNFYANSQGQIQYQSNTAGASIKLIWAKVGVWQNANNGHANVLLYINPGGLGQRPAVYGNSGVYDNGFQPTNFASAGFYSSAANVATGITLFFDSNPGFSGQFYLYKITT